MGGETFLNNNWILLKFNKIFIKVYVRQVFINVWQNFISSGHYVRQVLKNYLQPCLWTNKIKILKKWNNTWRHYHFTNINHSHMMHGSTDTECNRHNFLSFLDCFLPFYSLTTRKVKILKNGRKFLEISPFYTSVPKIMTICYTVP